jgi:hypothetical protein
VHLGSGGAFSTSGNGFTRRACLPPRHKPFSEVDAVLHAAYVRLVGHRLALYDDSRIRLGIFSRIYITTPTNPEVRLPGRVPSEADLIGAWRPALLGDGPWAAIPDLYPGQWLAFDTQSGGLRWHGEDGCNSVGGRASLGATGSFSTTGFDSTLVGCLGPGGKPTYTEANVMLHASQVRLVGHGLAFYHGGTRLGLFVRGK